MIIRRQYIKGHRYGYKYKPHIQTFHELCAYADENPDEGVFEKDNATYFIEPGSMNKQEQKDLWRQCTYRIQTNTREVLDNLDSVCEFKVWWNHYGKRPTIGKPPKAL